MAKYYIKDGYSEKGPYTVHELKIRKISKTTFVRKEDSSSWVPAESLKELKTIFTGNLALRSLAVKFLALIAVVFVVVFILNNYNRSTYSYDTYESFEEEVLVPSDISFSLSTHDRRGLKDFFKNCNLSGKNKELVKACNYTNSNVRNKAVSIAGQNPGNFNIGQVCDIFDYCYSNWKYVNDPRGQEIIEYASNTLFNGLNGDCDDFAVLVCSMVLSIGGEARISYAYNRNDGHAFTEVNIGKTGVEDYLIKRYKDEFQNEGVWTRTDQQGNKWLNLDWFAKHPGGKYYDFIRGTTFYIIQQACYDYTK